MDDLDNPQPIFLTQVLNKALDLYKGGFQFFISISLVYAIFAQVSDVLLQKMDIPDQELLFLKAIVNILIACWASVAIIYAAARLGQGKKIDANKALNIAKERYAVYLAVYLSLLLLLGFGFLLFIIPGLYFMTIFLFADILVVIEGAQFKNAFRQSAQLIRPFFWKAFNYLMIVVCISLIPELIYQVGLSWYPSLAQGIQKVAAVVIMPYLMIAQVLLYYQIKSRSVPEASSLEDQIDQYTNNE